MFSLKHSYVFHYGIFTHMWYHFFFHPFLSISTLLCIVYSLWLVSLLLPGSSHLCFHSILTLSFILNISSSSIIVSFLISLPTYIDIDKYTYLCIHMYKSRLCLWEKMIWICLTSFSTIFHSSIISCLYGWRKSHCEHKPHFLIHLSVDGFSDWLQFWTLMNSAVVNMNEQVSALCWLRVSWLCVQECMTGSYSDFIFRFL